MPILIVAARARAREGRNIFVYERVFRFPRVYEISKIRLVGRDAGRAVKLARGTWRLRFCPRFVLHLSLLLFMSILRKKINKCPRERFDPAGYFFTRRIIYRANYLFKSRSSLSLSHRLLLRFMPTLYARY